MSRNFTISNWQFINMRTTEINKQVFKILRSHMPNNFILFFRIEFF